VNYSAPAEVPKLYQGQTVPEPVAVGRFGPQSLKLDAESYVLTGKLPALGSARGPELMALNAYRSAIKNYAGAVLQSRGLSEQEVASNWRNRPAQLRFILGADGRATVSLGTTVRHLDTLQQLADAWDPKNLRPFNALAARVAKQFGYAEPTNIEAASHIIGSEIIKAIGVVGAGTEAERNAAAAAFNAAATPEQIAGAIRTVQQLLVGQLQGKRGQAMHPMVGMSEKDFRALIGERPYEILNEIDRTHGRAGAPAGGAPAGGVIRYDAQGNRIEQ
jgi:hypothetical protein